MATCPVCNTEVGDLKQHGKEANDDTHREAMKKMEGEEGHDHEGHDHE